MSQNTILSYGKDIQAFIESCHGSVTSDEFEELATTWLTRNKRRLSAKTIGRHKCSLNAFARANGMSIDALKTYRVPKPLKSDAHPIPEGIPGVLRMLAATDNEDHEVIIALCGLAGLRVAEALSIRPSQIDRYAKVLKVYGKGDRMRKIPISPALWNHIEMPYLKAIVDGDRTLVSIQDRSARRAVIAVARRAGLSRHVSSHDLRATFATAVYNQTGHNLRIVQELLGHSSIETTQLYLGIDPKEMSSAVNFGA